MRGRIWLPSRLVWLRKLFGHGGWNEPQYVRLLTFVWRVVNNRFSTQVWTTTAARGQTRDLRLCLRGTLKRPLLAAVIENVLLSITQDGKQWKNLNFVAYSADTARTGSRGRC